MTTQDQITRLILQARALTAEAQYSEPRLRPAIYDVIHAIEAEIKLLKDSL